MDADLYLILKMIISHWLLDLPQAPLVEIVVVNETTVSLNLMPVPRSDALGFIVTVDADVAISFCLAESNGPLQIDSNGECRRDFVFVAAI